MPVSGLVVTLTPPPEASPDVPPDVSPDVSPGAAPNIFLNTEEFCDGPGPVRDGHGSVIEQIRRHPHLQVGPIQGLRLPIVLDTPDRETDKRCWRWLHGLPGVHHVDVAFIHFEDADAFDASCCGANTDRPIAAPTIGET